MKTIKKLFIIIDILFLIMAGISIGVTVIEHNSLGFWGYLCAAVWCFNCLLRDIGK